MQFLKKLFNSKVMIKKNNTSTATFFILMIICIIFLRDFIQLFKASNFVPRFQSILLWVKEE